MGWRLIRHLASCCGRFQWRSPFPAIPAVLTVSQLHHFRSVSPDLNIALAPPFTSIQHHWPCLLLYSVHCVCISCVCSSERIECWISSRKERGSVFLDISLLHVSQPSRHSPHKGPRLCQRRRAKQFPVAPASGLAISRMATTNAHLLRYANLEQQLGTALDLLQVLLHQLPKIAKSERRDGTWRGGGEQ